MVAQSTIWSQFINNGLHLYSTLSWYPKCFTMTGGNSPQHYQCVAPTWVRHSSHLSTEHSPHISIRWRGREPLSLMIRWPDEDSQVGNFARTPLLFAIHAMGYLKITVSGDLGLSDLMASPTVQSPHHRIGVLCFVVLLSVKKQKGHVTLCCNDERSVCLSC